MAQNFKKDEKVGEILKKAREKTRKSVVRIAKEICIRRVYLEAIEECKYDETPGIAYTVGFIRSYADYLDLNADELVNMFNKETQNEYYENQIDPESYNEKEEVKKEVKKEEKKEKCVKQCVESCKNPTKIEIFIKQNILWIVGTLGAILAILIISLIISAFSRGSNEVAEPDLNISQNSSDLQLEGKKNEQDTPYFQAVKEKEEMELKKKDGKSAENVFESSNQIYGNINSQEIKLQAVSSVWVQITDVKSNSVIFSKLLKVGDEYRTGSNKDYTLTVGNAGGLKVILNDQDLGILGKEGQKKVDIVLDKQELQGYFN